MSKSNQNILQNPPNCFIFSKFSSGCMPPYHHSKRAVTTSLFLYKNDHFLYQILSKYTSRCFVENHSVLK